MLNLHITHKYFLIYFFYFTLLTSVFLDSDHAKLQNWQGYLQNTFGQ